MKWYEDPEYQLMCEKAEEIQEEKEFIYLGDWYFQGQAYLWTATPIYRETRVWLPSQEDLQEMVSSDLRIKLFDSNPALMSLKLFYDRISQNKYFWQFKTYNKLWLAFVYHELYQKKWNPESKKWEETK